MIRRTVLVMLRAAALLGASVSSQQRQPLLEKIGANDYDVVPNWALPYPKPGCAWGSVPGVFVESDDRIFVASRGEIKLPDPLPPGYLGMSGFRRVPAGVTLSALLVLSLASERTGAMPNGQDRVGVKAFSSATWGVALDYPSDWSVDDDGGEEVTFRSPEGVAVVLGRTKGDSPSEPAPGRRPPTPQCTTTVTDHHVTATVCVEPATLTRRAVLVLNARDGRQWRLALSTRGRDARIFDAMVASARPSP